MDYQYRVTLFHIKGISDAIQRIENPSEAVQLAAVTQNKGVIRYIENPLKSVRLIANPPSWWGWWSVGSK